MGRTARVLSLTRRPSVRRHGWGKSRATPRCSRRSSRVSRLARRRRVMKKRLDVLLVERGLAESRAQAQALVLAGQVPGYDKAGQQVDESAELEVGYGQLHPRIRDDPRVTVLERVNARGLRELPFAPELVVCDVSFVSVRKVLPAALALAAPGWEALVLVKPQFEAERGEARRGVVRDREVHQRVLREVAEAAAAWRAQVVGAVDSGLPGPKGN